MKTRLFNYSGVYYLHYSRIIIVCVCVAIPFILDVRGVVDVPAGVTQQEEGHHRISPPPFCGACLNFSREKDSAVPFPRRP